MKKNRIFIVEFVTGGGFNQNEIPSSLFAEGYGMLRSVIADFNDLDYEIETFLDFRILLLSRYLKADFINVIQRSDNFFKKFKDCVRKNEFCFIIAPEFSNILYSLTELALDNNSTVLSVNLKGIRLGSSKLKTFNFFYENKIKTPPTFLVPYEQEQYNFNFIINKFRQFNSPIILKPEDGVGAEGIHYFDSEGKILEAFNKKSPLIDQSRPYILQKFVEGKDLSVSLIGHKDSPIIIGINAQSVNIKDTNKESRYLGGYTPVENWESLIPELRKNFDRIKFEPFDSYFGLDFIQQENGLLNFIEINPRITTSYIGIRNIIKQNLIEVVLNARNNEFNVDRLDFQNFSKFRNLTLNYKGNISYIEVNETIIPQILKMIPEVITPPVKIKGLQEDCYSCFIATKTKDFLSSEIRINKIINIFKKKDFFIKSLELI